MVFSNRQRAIHLSKNNAYHSKTTYISIEYHYIKDTIAAGDITVKKIHIADNPADMLTNPLSITKF